jgi:hypothetical protein
MTNRMRLMLLTHVPEVHSHWSSPMRSFLRLTTLIASLLWAACTFPGCSQDEGKGSKIDGGAMPTGKMSGAKDKGKMDDGAMDKDKMGGAMDKGKMDDGAMKGGKMAGGAMDKDKMAGGAMDKDKMEGTSK